MKLTKKQIKLIRDALQIAYVQGTYDQYRLDFNRRVQDQPLLWKKPSKVKTLILEDTLIHGL